MKIMLKFLGIVLAHIALFAMAGLLGGAVLFHPSLSVWTASGLIVGLAVAAVAANEGALS